MRVSKSKAAILSAIEAGGAYDGYWFKTRDDCLLRAARQLEAAGTHKIRDLGTLSNGAKSYRVVPCFPPQGGGGE